MDDAEQLMMAALDDELDPDHRATLRAALERDPILGERWVALVRQERQLRHWGQQRDGAGAIMAKVRRVATVRGPVLRFVRWGALAAGLVLAAFLAWWALRPQHPAPVTAPASLAAPSSAPVMRLIEVSGAVEIARLGAVPGGGADLIAGDRITIGAGGGATLTGDRGVTRLKLASGSSLHLLGEANGTRLALDAGTMAAMVAPQPLGKPLRIYTPHAVLRVVGTRFSLAVARSTTLTVGEGVVAVRRKGEPSEVMVRPGVAFDSAVTGLGSGITTVWVRNAQWERIVTAGTASPNRVASQAVAPSSDPSFHPDQLICLQSGIKDGGAPGDHLFLAPPAMTIDLRLRAERAGTVMVVLAPSPTTPTDVLHAGAKAVPVGPTWTTISIAGDALSSHAFPHGLPVGTKVWAISIFGFAAGRLELERIVVHGGPAGAP